MVKKVKYLVQFKSKGRWLTQSKKPSLSAARKYMRAEKTIYEPRRISGSRGVYKGTTWRVVKSKTRRKRSKSMWSF